MPPIRAALWAAVSSKPQAEKVSNKEQLRLGHVHAEKIGATVTAELVVPGESRNIVLFEDAARKIPAYAELKRLIDGSEIDVLIYLDRSRLGRQASLSLSVVALCTEAGIATYDMESPPTTLKAGGSTDELLMGAIKSMNAQTEIEKLRYRHRMGMAGRVRKGLAPGNLAYGYTVQYDAKGKRIAVVDPAAAAIVQRIVERYLSGQGGEKIADDLNADGIPSPGGSVWTRHTIVNLLSKAHWWAGQAMLNRHSKTGRQLVQAPAQWVPIIDAITYAAIQEEREARTPNRRLADAKHILSGVCICQVCGSNMTIATVDKYPYSYITCRQRHGYTAVRDDAVLAFIRQQLEMLRSVNIDTMLDAGDMDVSTKLAERIEAQRQVIAKAQQSMRRVDDAYADGTLDGERYKVQVERIKAQTLQAIAETERLQALAEQDAAAGTRRQRLEDARDYAIDMLDGPPSEANAYLRRLLRVWCEHKTIVSVEWQ